MKGLKIISATRVNNGVWRYELERKQVISVIADGESSEYLYRQMYAEGDHDVDFYYDAIKIDGYKLRVREMVGIPMEELNDESH